MLNRPKRLAAAIVAIALIPSFASSSVFAAAAASHVAVHHPVHYAVPADHQAAPAAPEQPIPSNCYRSMIQKPVFGEGLEWVNLMICT
ncbi:MAG: hypothetical protein BGP04_04140 [Rhizobiales bacterium 62-17]|mgnify:CR=1 FL=1|nr:hypothetical protein [Hyphomicrobiales bacterium]OJY04572.1 MAG: hypothetical protein BGP04_04140 [Rhizobiales bacterium 62-17]